MIGLQQTTGVERCGIADGYIPDKIIERSLERQRELQRREERSLERQIESLERENQRKHEFIMMLEQHRHEMAMLLEQRRQYAQGVEARALSQHSQTPEIWETHEEERREGSTYS